METAAPTVIDYAPFVAAHAGAFVGRRWVFDRLDAWLAQPGPRVFRLTGEPGSGKTALSSRLSQFSDGAAAAPAGLTRLAPGFLDAVHFCSGRDRRWVDPLTFARSIASQLAARHATYARALVEKSGDRQVHIDVTQNVSAVEASAQLAGVVIKELNLSGVSAEDAFNRLVREPLEALFRAEPASRVTILVDALDESLVYTGEVGVVPLLAQAEALPAGVRFLLTSRPEPEIDRRLAAVKDVAELSLSADEWDASNRDDVAAYIDHRFRTDAALAAAASALSKAAVRRVVAAILDRSGYNFLYVRFLLDAVASGQWSLRELDAQAPSGEARMPATGLDALYLLYFDSLQRAIDVGKRDWVGDYAPLMETLSVAQETLSRDQLRAFAGQNETRFRANLADLRQFVEQVATAGSAAGGFRLYHQSFGDFLRTPELRLTDHEVENTFYLSPAEAHARVADYIAQRYSGCWDACDDRYALRYAATHYAGAASVDAQPDRHERSTALVDLVTDDEFRRSHERALDDPIALRRDLEQALATAAADDDRGAPLLVVRSALALDALRREQLRPEVLFDLARSGDVDGAARRLGLFRADEGWRQAASLVVALVAADANPAGARKLRDRTTADGVDPILAPLVARLAVALDGAPPPPRAPLPPSPNEWQVKELLARLGGNAVSGIEPLSGEPIQQLEHGNESDARGAARAYLAEQDGPLLVAFARNGPAQSTEYLRQYIAANASNNYEFYRNRSLWALIPAVVAHPDDTWVRERLVELAKGALAGTHIHFREALPLTVHALRAKAGGEADATSFEARRGDAVKRASHVTAEREGDPWSHHLRRLIALAEAHACALGRPDLAFGLLDSAIALPFGFAGFTAAARLTLAEVVRIVRPGDAPMLEKALAMARASAHNVQDFVLCARATSRVNAIGESWRMPTDDERLSHVVASFAHNPAAERFAPIHEVGEEFARRVDAANKLPIPEWARDARTLEQVAQLYARPVAELVLLNEASGWNASDPLPPKTKVAIPDPDYAPLLAARFAAEALATEPLPRARRALLIQSLAPIAARDPTAMDVVLARLLLAALPTDTKSLAHLAESIARYLPPDVLGEAPTPNPALPA